MKTGPKPKISTCGHPELKHCAKGMCKNCYDKVYVKTRYAADPVFRAHRRTRHLENRYGITREKWAEYFEAQQGKCKICGNDCRDPNGRFHNLCVDHDHKTGKFRGLLCKFCNSKLGWFENRKEIITAYLEGA